MKISRMSEQNVNKVKQIADECFTHAWSLASIRAELEKEGSFFFVAENYDEPVGYIGFNIVLDEGYIANLAVREKFRHQGTAKRLLQKVIDTSEEKELSFVSLEVRQSNVPAISLYKMFGFTEEGKRRNFYSHPTEDGLIMTLFLRNTNENSGN